MGVPAPPQLQQQMAGPQMMLLHSQMAPPAQSAMESHTVHVHVTDDPRLTRIQAMPRLHVCPACHATGPTLVSSSSWQQLFSWWQLQPACLQCGQAAGLVHTVVSV
jgi:hypothetical protein